MHPTATEKINIAIDGYSGCGKSTLAKDLARCLNYIYLDSGAMYRAVTLFFQHSHLDYLRADELEQGLKDINITFDHSGEQPQMLLNGENVEKQIRSQTVNEEVSQIARVSVIRRFLVEKQKRIARNKGVIMEGRDIGTVVLPSAEYKLFLTAETETRVNRRYEQLMESDGKVDIDSIRKNLIERDRIDSSRKDSPLRKAADAIVLDNTNLSREQQLLWVVEDILRHFNFIQLNKDCLLSKASR
ncbi:MAG: (d)CMP kinase [Saprospirales bacterium]|nr:MAG: (d)CMP kinase [Saprospirales bacterium]